MSEAVFYVWNVLPGVTTDRRGDFLLHMSMEPAVDLNHVAEQRLMRSFVTK